MPQLIKQITTKNLKPMETTKNLTEAQAKFISKLSKENVFVPSELKDLSKLTGLPTCKGLEQAVISNGKIVNVVSNQYGHLPNEVFFKEVESRIYDAGLSFVTRSINRDDRSFAVDYIITDNNAVTVKKGHDIIMPMLRFTNSYDGSNKTSGHFGFFRQVCANGLHVAQSEIQFSLKHRGAIVEFAINNIHEMFIKFLDNEFYSIKTSFETLAESYINDVNGTVKTIAEQTNLFKFEKSDKNAEPSLNAQMVLDIANHEASLVSNGGVTLWNVYNAFNEVLHTKLKKSFEQQKRIDEKLFNTVLEMAN